MVIKKHWLYGDCKFNIDVQKEDSCSTCIHSIVCEMDREKFCLNYNFGTSEGRGCDGCLHRFTRYYTEDKDRIPCFKCKYYQKSDRTFCPICKTEVKDYRKHQKTKKHAWNLIDKAEEI